MKSDGAFITATGIGSTLVGLMGGVLAARHIWKLGGDFLRNILAWFDFVVLVGAIFSVLLLLGGIGLLMRKKLAKWFLTVLLFLAGAASAIPIFLLYQGLPAFAAVFLGCGVVALLVAWRLTRCSTKLFD